MQEEKVEKIIPREVRLSTVYKCDYCFRRYDNKQECQTCEKNCLARKKFEENNKPLFKIGDVVKSKDYTPSFVIIKINIRLLDTDVYSFLYIMKEVDQDGYSIELCEEKLTLVITKEDLETRKAEVLKNFLENRNSEEFKVVYDSISSKLKVIYSEKL